MNEQDSEEIVKYRYAQRKSGILSFMVSVGCREYGDFSTFD